MTAVLVLMLGAAGSTSEIDLTPDCLVDSLVEPGEQCDSSSTAASALRYCK